MSRSETIRRGFTLIEVLLVLVILAALATVAVVTLWPAKEEANINLTKLKIEKVILGLQRYSLNLGPPTEDQGLKALLEKPTFDDEKQGDQWHGPYCTVDDLKDAWKKDLVYKIEEVTTGDKTRPTPRIYSIGPNGNDEQGEGDDIKNSAWESASDAD